MRREVSKLFIRRAYDLALDVCKLYETLSFVVYSEFYSTDGRHAISMSGRRLIRVTYGVRVNACILTT